MRTMDSPGPSRDFSALPATQGLFLPRVISCPLCQPKTSESDGKGQGDAQPVANSRFLSISEHGFPKVGVPQVYRPFYFLKKNMK